ncbi:MAG: flagellar basal body-associated FliL family protein, partial [Desulfomonilaceae bacterium]
IAISAIFLSLLHYHNWKPTQPPETALTLQAITVNLSGFGERFLRIKPVLVFPAPLKQQIETEQYKIVDRIITTLRDDRYSMLIMPDGQKIARQQVAKAAAAIVPGVQKAYFTQFLID